MWGWTLQKTTTSRLRERETGLEQRTSHKARPPSGEGVGTGSLSVLSESSGGRHRSNQLSSEATPSPRPPRRSYKARPRGNVPCEGGARAVATQNSHMHRRQAHMCTGRAPGRRPCGVCFCPWSLCEDPYAAAEETRDQIFSFKRSWFFSP